MKIKLIRSYRSANGNVVFVYGVTGTQAQLEEFKTVQGDFYREDETTGQALWFTTRCVGNTGNLIITTNGKVVADMSAFDQAASLAEQYGGNFGQELARSAAAQILGGTPATEAPVETPVAETPVAKTPATEAPVAETPAPKAEESSEEL